MALEEFVGAVSMEVDGREIEVSKVSVKTTTGRRPVKTMNRAKRIKGFSRGITTHDLTVSAVIPKNGSPVDWENIEGAKITIQSVEGGKRTSYLDCFTIEVGESYQVEGEAMIDLSMAAVRKVTE
jgi:hypothetical protein